MVVSKFSTVISRLILHMGYYFSIEKNGNQLRGGRAPCSRMGWTWFSFPMKCARSCTIFLARYHILFSNITSCDLNNGHQPYFKFDSKHNMACPQDGATKHLWLDCTDNSCKFGNMHMDGIQDGLGLRLALSDLAMLKYIPKLKIILKIHLNW